MLKGNLIKRALTGGLVIAAVGFPSAAQARFNLNPVPFAGSSPPVASSPSVQQTESSTQSGFQWGDAAIGAAGTVVLLGAGVAASGATRRRRTQRTVVG
jgi:hypothetical protein